MTNQELIDKALQEISAVDSGSSATAAESADMLDMLNSMMAKWSMDSMDLQFPPQDTLGDTCPIPTWAEEAVISNLAMTASPSFVSSYISPLLAAKASMGLLLVKRVCINSELRPVDLSYLPGGSATSSNYNINTDQ